MAALSSKMDRRKVSTVWFRSCICFFVFLFQSAAVAARKMLSNKFSPNRCQRQNFVSDEKWIWSTHRERQTNDLHKYDSLNVRFDHPRTSGAAIEAISCQNLLVVFMLCSLSNPSLKLSAIRNIRLKWKLILPRAFSYQTTQRILSNDKVINKFTNVHPLYRRPTQLVNVCGGTNRIVPQIYGTKIVCVNGSFCLWLQW